MTLNLSTENFTRVENLTLEEFKSEYRAGRSVANQYYSDLSFAAKDAYLSHVMNYADLARDVANNAAGNGALANDFTRGVALRDFVSFEVGSDNWLKMQYTLMQEDYSARKNNISDGGTGEINYRAIIDIHAAALDEVGLPKEGFSLHTPLTILEKISPDQAQQMLNVILLDNGGDGVIDAASDILFDSLTLTLTGGVSAQQLLADVVGDYYAQL